MSKKIIVASVAVIMVIGVAVFLFYATRERPAVPRELSFKAMGIDVDATKYVVLLDLYRDRLLLSFVDFTQRESHFTYIYNFTTGKSTNLTGIADEWAGYHMFCGDTVIWGEERLEKEIYNASSLSLPERFLYGYDLKTGKKFEIYSNEGNRRLELGSYRTFGDWVAWSTMESDDGVSLYNPESYLRNLKTGETYYIPEGRYLGIS